MSNLLKIVCIALSIYYACMAPTLAPLEQTINELISLRSVTEDNLYLNFPYPIDEKKNVSVEELSCRAKHCIEELKDNKPEKLKSLLHFLTFLTVGVDCTELTHKKHEKTEEIRTIIEYLLEEFRKHFVSQDLSK